MAAVPLKPKSVAVDTCVMMDLAAEDAVTIAAIAAVVGMKDEAKEASCAGHHAAGREENGFRFAGRGFLQNPDLPRLVLDHSE